MKDIESIRRVNVVQGTGPRGGAIGIVKCASGWMDESGETEFAVPWNNIRDYSYTELEERYCLVPIQQGGGGGGGGGLTVRMGFYKRTAGEGCTQLLVSPRTLGGELRSVSVQCLDDDVYSDFNCLRPGDCNNRDASFRYFDNDTIQIRQNRTLSAYQFETETDTCLENGGKRYRGCWIFAAGPASP